MPPVYMALFVSHFRNNSEIGYVREREDFTIFLHDKNDTLYCHETKTLSYISLWSIPKP